MRTAPLLLALLLLAPAAAAEVSIEVLEAPSEPIVPGLESRPLRLAVTATCETTDSLFGQPIPIALSGQPAEGVQLSGEFNVSLDASSCQSIQPEAPSEEVTLDVSLAPDVPGLQPLRNVITAQRDGDDQIASAEFEVVGAYVGTLQIIAEEKVMVADSESGEYRRASFEMDVTNLGNARTVVQWEVTDEPSPGRPVQRFLPEDVVLDVGAAATVVFLVEVREGTLEAQFGYSLSATPVAFLDPEQAGTPTQVNLVVRVEEVEEKTGSNDTPSAGLMAIPLLLAVAWAARRRAL